MQPLKPYQSLYKVYSPLGATNKEAQDKMNYNRERYGDFIGKALGDKERETLTNVVIDEVAAVLDQFGLKST